MGHNGIIAQNEVRRREARRATLRALLARERRWNEAARAREHAGRPANSSGARYAQWALAPVEFSRLGSDLGARSRVAPLTTDRDRASR
jgi:hypothetical protein